jgi:hypothetical protein
LCVVVQRSDSGCELVDPGPNFDEVIPHRPEQPQDAEQVRQRLDVVSEEPADSGAQVGVLNLQALRPLGLPHTAQGPIGALRLIAEEVRVASLDVGEIGVRRRLLDEELPDGLEHAEPRLVGCCIDADKAVPNERFDQVEGPVLAELGDARGRLDGPAVDEHGERGEHGAFGFVQEPDTPVDGGAQGALTFGQIYGACARGYA